MAITLPECTSVVEELQSVLPGGRIQKIHQPRPLTLVFEIRQPGQTHSLLVCVDPPFARLHLASRTLENPPTPPPFCMFLRSRLEGGRIESVSQVPDDRVVFLTIRTRAAGYRLAVALTGRQSNVFLLDEHGSILQSLKPSRQPPGTTYTPPPKEGEAPRASMSSPDRHSHETSPAPSRPSSAGSPVPPSVEFAERFPVSAQLEGEYGEREQNVVQHRLVNEALARTRKALKQAWKRVVALEADLSKAAQYRDYGRYGELLKGSWHAIEPGAERVTVIDYYDPRMPELTIPLDPTQDPAGNLAEYFRKYHKYLSAEQHLRPRLAAAKEEVARLETELARLERGEQPTMILAKPAATPAARPPGSRHRPDGQRPRPREYREFLSLDGLPILVGKTAHDNETLTFKLAAPDDLWLHARGTPGSHVIVRLSKRDTIPPETLRDAATLALWYSDLRKSGKGEVLYTKRKFVKKAKGHKPGAVQVSREKSLWVTIDPDRLERLNQRTTEGERPQSP